MKSFIKKKAKSPNPGFRTSDHFKAKVFRPEGPVKAGFDPSKFKVQHKG